jgi:putative ABC transport system substrate-binding protein
MLAWFYLTRQCPREPLKFLRPCSQTTEIVALSDRTATSPTCIALAATLPAQAGFLMYLGPKRLELVRELRPNAAMIAMLVNPNLATVEADDIQVAARNVGQKIDILKASSIRDIDAQLVVLAARHAIPTVYFRREFAVAGGLMSYGSNAEEPYRVLGVYTGRILRGEKPGDLPIQRPTKFELVINVGTARALGFKLPETLLARADEVIE